MIMKEMLNVQNLTVCSGNKKILNSIDFSANEGEFIGIIGPNGAGKSTFIKAITDLIDIKDGKVTIDGTDNKKLSKRNRAKLVAVVPQEFNVDFEFSVFDIVMMGRNPHIQKKKPETKNDIEIVRDAMRLTNTWHLKDRIFNEISGGEKQRAIIARAIAQQTKLILMDEPTSHLDIHHQIEILELANMLRKKKNITIIAVLHDINMAARFCDKLVLISEGKKIAEGPPDKVIDKKYLQQVYKMEMIIRKNKILSVKEIVPLRVMKDKKVVEKLNVHVICGGGTGSQLLERLISLGFDVSSGVLNIGDSDWEVCRMLGIKCIEVPPFSSIAEKHMIENLKLIEKADIILITDVPYGIENIKNLEVLLNLDADKKIFIKKSHSKFDYTGGRALAIIEELEKRGNLKCIENYEEFIDMFTVQPL